MPATKEVSAHITQTIPLLEFQRINKYLCKKAIEYDNKGQNN